MEIDFIDGQTNTIQNIHTHVTGTKMKLGESD